MEAEGVGRMNDLHLGLLICCYCSADPNTGSDEERSITLFAELLPEKYLFCNRN